MHALLVALAVVMGAGAIVAGIASAFSRAAILALLSLVPFLIRYHKRIYIIINTLPRDLKFLYRYCCARIRSKRWDRKNATVADLFQERAAKYPNSPCLICEGKTWTFSLVEDYSNRIAQVFWQAGIRRGDVVCVYLPNSAEYVCTWLGLSKIGAISALVNNNLRHQPLLHSVRVANAKAIIFNFALADAISEIEKDLPSLALYCAGEGQLLKSSWIGLSSLLAAAPPVAPLLTPEQKPGYKDRLLYIYTSGTTGMPKAAVLPNSKYLLVVVATFHMLGLRRWDGGRKGDIMYNPLPLYHTAGGMVGTGVALVDGIPVVIRPKFSASNYWSDCIKYKCTVAQYIGEMCRYLLAQPHRPTDTQHSVRIMVGNGMRHAIWQNIVDRFNISQVNEVYGATEGNANIINVDNTVGAVGFIPSIVPKKFHPMAVVKVDNQGNPIRGADGFCIRCAPNEPGMFLGIIKKGDASREYHGYIDKEDSNKKLITNVFRKGEQAFISGDILVMDNLGYLFFKDRTGDTFKWKGENVSTAEVEGIVSNICDQKACIVYGVSIPMVEGRAGMAAIAVERGGKIDLEALAGGVDLSLPSYARPLFVRIMEDIEITGTFKLKKLSYQKEGFDPDSTKDAIYFRNGSNPWQRVTREIYSDICLGHIKL